MLSTKAISSLPMILTAIHMRTMLQLHHLPRTLIWVLVLQVLFSISIWVTTGPSNSVYPTLNWWSTNQNPESSMIHPAPFHQQVLTPPSEHILKHALLSFSTVTRSVQTLDSQWSTKVFHLYSWSLSTLSNPFSTQNQEWLKKKKSSHTYSLLKLCSNCLSF